MPVRAFATGECGLSCCIAGAAGGGVTMGESLGLTFSQDYSFMETIRHGTGSLSPDEVIRQNQKPGMAYKVPTEMVMQKYSLTTAVPIKDGTDLLITVPYLINDMKMRKRSPMGMVMDMKMDTVKGLGDISLLALHVLDTDANVRPTKRLTVGMGLKLPTGSASAKGKTGLYVHAMMQTGTSSWDALFMANYMRAFYPLVLQANIFYQLTTEGGNGYEFGNQLSYNLSGSYQVAKYVNAGLELTGFHTGKDSDSEGRYSNPMISMADDTDNTGLDSILIAPLVQVKIPGTGGSIGIKTKLPIYQRVNGYQQVLDWRVSTALTWVF